MNKFAKIAAITVTGLATAFGVFRILSTAAANSDEALFEEHPENGAGLINLVPDLEPVAEVKKAPEVKPLPVVEKAPEVKPLPLVEEAPVAKPLPVVESTPSEEVPVVEEPVEAVPVVEVPVEEVPIVEEPVAEVPVVEAPVEETPVEETPIEETPIEETPVEEAPVEETPVEEAPVEETPVEEAPVEEAPVEETPVEEAPVEEAPVEEAPVEEAPVEEVPVVEEPDTQAEEVFMGKTTQVGGAAVSDDVQNGFIKLVSAAKGEDAEHLVVLAAPNTTPMVFAFEGNARTADSLKTVYFVSPEGDVTEAPAAEQANVLSFGRAFIGENAEFRAFLEQ